MEFIAGPKGILDWVLVVRGMEVEKVHGVCPQPLEGGVQLRTHALWFQRLPVPGVGLGSYAYCHTETLNCEYVNLKDVFNQQTS